MAVISKKMQEALNEQVNAEMYSSNLYLAMSAYFESIDLPGFANWMRIQAKEEDTHVQKIFDYIIERGGRAAVGAIKKPQAEWKSPLDAFNATYKIIIGYIENYSYCQTSCCCNKGFPDTTG